MCVSIGVEQDYKILIESCFLSQVMKIGVWFDLYSAGREGEGKGHDCCFGQVVLEMMPTRVLVRPVKPTLRVHHGATARASYESLPDI